MAYTRLAITVAIATFCALCAVQETQAMDWKSLPAVKQFLRSNPRARIMTQGPWESVIDLLVQLLIRLIETILTDPLRAQLGSISDRVSLLEGSRF